MGPLAPVTPWIPEDDLVLKNAVEAGASLESLAKGAVQFSQRFTIRELQDRWHSLLYDPVISAEASAHMIEVERSASNFPSKSNRADNSKGSIYSLGKRNTESVRKCYYAMRKRICNEPLNQGDLSFLVAPGDSCYGNGNDAMGPSNMLDDLGLEDTDFRALNHVFPQVERDSAPPCVGGSSHGFQLGQQNNHRDLSIEENNRQEEIPPLLGETLAVNGHCSDLGAVDASKESLANNLFVAHDVDTNNINSSAGNMCSEFGRNQVFTSSISDCGTSFHHLHYSPSPLAVPDWRTLACISSPEMPGEASIRGKDLQAGNAVGIPHDGDAGEIRTSEFKVVQSESKLKSQIPCNELKNSAEGYLAQLSDSLLNFTSEEEMLFMEVDGKNIIDNSYLDGFHSFLFNSPDDASGDQMSNIPDTKSTVAPEMCLDIPTGSCAGEMDNDKSSCFEDKHFTTNSEEQMPSSVSSVDCQFPELQNGVICCTLNTEYPEIPCNDDIVLPPKPQPSSFHRRTLNEPNQSAASTRNSSINKTTEVGVGIVKREPHAISQTREPENGHNRAGNEFGVKFELPISESVNVASRHPTCQSTLVPKKEACDSVLPLQSGCKLDDKSALVSDSFLQNGDGGLNQEGQAPASIRNEDLHAQVGSRDTVAREPVGQSLLSDHEELSSDSVADIPYFSDIESMILDMDLGPGDQDSYSSRKVAKYQNEEAKRALIRLEQGAHSYMQRAMTSHGAFAILYGRRSKHYIKKPEVLLGRATCDVTVDIDLSREGRANKVSRRQAIIKMDKDGLFHLKNLGRFLILVDSREVYPGQSLCLHSNCLIEIQGMPFMFEVNQARIKQYLDDAARRIQFKGRKGLNA
ncbi:hypothetical protein Ancab_013010 [Ancistrocladus abbreviatus]